MTEHISKRSKNTNNDASDLIELFEPLPYDGCNWDDISKILDTNWIALNKADTESKNKGILVGRYLKEQIADGFAIYLIIKENKTSVRIKRLSYICGDEWSVPYWGEKATIDKKYALESIKNRDAWNKRMTRSS